MTRIPRKPWVMRQGGCFVPIIPGEKAADAWAALIAGLQTVEPSRPHLAQGISP